MVNDSRGFYTSRVVATYIREGHLMLIEGVPRGDDRERRPHGRHAGRAARAQRRGGGRSRLEDPAARPEADLGAGGRRSAPAVALLDEMVEKRGRLGRKNGKGFYDYPDKGPKRLWPGLAELQPTQARSRRDRRRRSSSTASWSSRHWRRARCFEEGVLTDVREADVGSILGFGFAPFTGGTLSYIDVMGTQALRRALRGAGEETRPALQAGETAARHGGQRRHVLRPLRRANGGGGVKSDPLPALRPTALESRDFNHSTHFRNSLLEKFLGR